MRRNDKGESVLAQLRAERWGFRPQDAEATTKLAERQATLLIGLTGRYGQRVDEAIWHLPRISVLHANIPTSGLALWDGRQWVITLNSEEPRTRQRFTLLHEYKHIIDHPNVDWLYRDHREGAARAQAEAAADYFAGCALVPRLLLLAAWHDGIQGVGDLARHFDVSPAAISVRLTQVGLDVTPGQMLARSPATLFGTAQHDSDTSLSAPEGAAA